MSFSSRIICLGEILFDRLADRRGNSVIAVDSWTDYPGGALANVASALVKLGTPAAFIGSVGRDEAGNNLLAILAKIGVNIEAVQRHPTAPTRKVYVLRDRKGDRSFAGFGDFKPDEFADALLQKEKLDEKLFQEADFLVLGTLGLAYPQTRGAIFRALELSARYDLKVVLDVNWRPMFWVDRTEALPLIKRVLKYVNFLKVSEEEAELLFNTKDAEAIAARLKSVDGVIVTAGAGDISYYLGENEAKLTPISVKVRDTTGAGDAFVAGFLHQLSIRGITVLKDANEAKEVVRYASAVGSLTTTKLGAIDPQPTAKEVEDFLKHN